MYLVSDDEGISRQENGDGSPTADGVYHRSTSASHHSAEQPDLATGLTIDDEQKAKEAQSNRPETMVIREQAHPSDPSMSLSVGQKSLSRSVEAQNSGPFTSDEDTLLAWGVVSRLVILELCTAATLLILD